MAKRGRPKGSKNSKSKDNRVMIPRDAIIWHEIWHKNTRYGWSLKKFRPGMISFLFKTDGDLEKAKKLDKYGEYFKHLETKEPMGTKKNPIHIQRVR
jgi:hypothetical protein